MSQSPRPADAAVRERALDPSASFIVQAPAGSGKTELLTRRYLRLLAVVERPEDILAITFTRKAAAEMRGRILKALALGASEQPPPEEYKEAAWQLARAARAADARHGWRLEAHPARLKIQTIDALNHTLARQLPILSGSGASLRIADDSEPLYAQAVLRVIEHLGTDSPVAAAVERLVRHLDNQVGTLTTLLTDLLQRRDHWLDLDLLHSDRTVLKERLESALEAAVVQRLRRLNDLWPAHVSSELLALASAARGRLRAAGADHALAASTLDAFPGSSVDDLADWQGLRQLLLTADGSWRKKITKSDGIPADEKADNRAANALLDELRSVDGRLGGDLAGVLDETRTLPPVRYSGSQWKALEALLEVLKIAVAELALVFRERGEADHVAAALAGRQALGTIDAPTDLALQLDYRLKHLLVDEFQDTSRSQIRLLRLLTAGWTPGDGRSLFLVGDPMQSIYRFREADVGLFLKLQGEGLGDVHLEPLTLTVNFRSTQPVIDWVNASFRRVLPAEDDPERGGVRFTPSESRPAVPQEGGVHFHALVGTKDAARSQEAERVASIVAAARHRDPQCRIAILVPTRGHLVSILPALAGRGFRYQAVDIDPLRDRPVVQDLLALTRALVHLADRTAWLAILRAPWCGLTLDDLHVIAADAGGSRWQVAAIWSRVNDSEVVARLSVDGRQRVARLRSTLTLALDERGRWPLRDWVERAWLGLSGPAATTTAAELADAEAYFVRLDRLSQAGDLDDIANLEDEIADLHAVPDAVGEGPPAIEVMTLHKAKGLEFDTVILPGLERKGGRDGERLLRWVELPRADEGPSLLLGPLAAREEEKDPLYKWLGDIEKERAAFERGRQLYVGATRAIRELHLIGSAQIVDKKGTLDFKPPDPDSFLKLLWPLVISQFQPLLVQTQASDSVGDKFESTPLRRLPPSWSPSFEGLAGTDVEPPVTSVDKGLQPEFDWVSETGRHVGTLVHREIERLAARGLRDALRPDERSLQRYERELAELGVPETHRPGAAQRVAAAMTNLLEDERGRWLLAGADTHRDIASELALSGIVGRSIVNGVIDRTFVDVKGTRWIVDFKTSLHSGAGLEAFLDSEAVRYQPQLQRYAELMRAYQPGEPVKAALYFPLLKAWKEVDVANG
ncbi:MAG: UvrD-helicase domain-containing protein [Steroidobacteraceae bacterium]